LIDYDKFIDNVDDVDDVIDDDVYDAIDMFFIRVLDEF